MLNVSNISNVLHVWNVFSAHRLRDFVEHFWVTDIFIMPTPISMDDSKYGAKKSPVSIPWPLASEHDNNDKHTHTHTKI